jgi:hypothetical protein
MCRRLNLEEGDTVKQIRHQSPTPASPSYAPASCDNINHLQGQNRLCQKNTRDIRSR